jgi:hypothetical protein
MENVFVQLQMRKQVGNKADVIKIQGRSLEMRWGGIAWGYVGVAVDVDSGADAGTRVRQRSMRCLRRVLDVGHGRVWSFGGRGEGIVTARGCDMKGFSWWF